MAPERKWVLRRGDGMFVAGNLNIQTVMEALHARRFETVHDAYEFVQQKHSYGYDIWRAVPVERSTGRTVKVADRVGGLMFVLAVNNTSAEFLTAGGGTTGYLHDAAVFSPIDLLQFEDSRRGWCPVPVRVMESPGAWRVAEDGEG